jgi:hypothetical protein
VPGGQHYLDRKFRENAARGSGVVQPARHSGEPNRAFDPVAG